MLSIKESENVLLENEKKNISVIQLGKRIKASVKKLRDSYYDLHQEEPLEHVCAFGGKPTESIGAFAEYNLRSSHCPRSMAGLCTPCFYSKFPKVLSTNKSTDNYVSYLIEQIDYIIDNFDKTILSKQSGNIYYNKCDMLYTEKSPVACCITPVGSFFDENEFPTTVRLYLLNRLISISEEQQLDIILYAETHVKDYIKYVNKYATDEELNLFQKLHFRIVFGFESKDEYVRNILYGKDLSLSEFESAVKQAHIMGFGVYAFTFIGLYPMSHSETIYDIEESFQYLKTLNVSPVVMFANVQEYTIADVLLQSGQYRLLNPITVIEVIQKMLDIFGRIRSDGIDAWLIADPVGGPPEPTFHIFSDPDVSCCSKIIYELILKLRANHEFDGFDSIYRKVSECPIHKANTQFLYQKISTTIEQRTEKMIDYIELHSDSYLKSIRERELLYVKAHLLCEGVQIDNLTREALSKLGITDGFIHSSNLLLDNHPVNACLLQKFVLNPYCEISYANQKFYLKCKADESISQSELIGEIDFIKIPEWGNAYVDGYKVSDYLRPHSKNCISIWPNQKCSFSNAHCRFCTLSNDGICLSLNTVIRMIEVALDYNPLYDVHLSGGVCCSFTDNIEYYSSIAKGIHEKYPKVKISLETIPPLKKDGLEYYKKSGISSILMNIEIADEKIRKQICPGKFNISRSRYLEAYREAVSLFGRWNVGSVVLYGIEGVSYESIIGIVKEMCDIGVYPVLMPFQPLRGSAMDSCPPTNPESYITISSEVGRLIKSAIGSDAICSFGCIDCGACSIENYFHSIY